ncbi:ABC transporter permease [Enterovirga rhinocerotis]|uniref:Capsular polysaccharide transport system permease protein n=1 Tax=Enterovirga rhinocerotis TaxID=1339210 RepID=A0A4R7BU69_9HYPH|nr:ABC transporter permease [Enterovirga rhinocerotis]TDR89290.1 capsular polysaccharide transport system permease protein [Enterovirga rhinocerotis]
MGWFRGNPIARSVEVDRTQWFQIVRRRVSILLLLTRRTLGERFSRSRFAGLVSVFEPLGMILMFTLLHSLVPGPPPFGSSGLLFFASGVMPFYLFFHLSSRIRNIDNYRPFPGATRIDHVVARAIGEVFTKFTIFFAFVIITSFFDPAVNFPVNPFICMAAMASMATLGCAIGLVNATIVSMFSSWVYIYALIGRIPLFLSGIPFVQDRAPVYIRDLIASTPFSHLITWFRSGYYVGYPTKTMDLPFALSICAIALFIGILIDDNTREYRSTD